MEVMTKKSEFKKGSYQYSLMGTGDKATHLHVDNIKTNKSSVIIPINTLKDILNENTTIL